MDLSGALIVIRRPLIRLVCSHVKNWGENSARAFLREESSLRHHEGFMVASMNPFSRDVVPRFRPVRPTAAPKFGPTEPSIMNPLMIGTMKGPRRDFWLARLFRPPTWPSDRPNVALHHEPFTLEHEPPCRVALPLGDRWRVGRLSPRLFPSSITYTRFLAPAAAVNGRPWPSEDIKADPGAGIAGDLRGRAVFRSDH